MKKEIWICMIHTFAQPSVVSSDGYSSLSKAADALMMRVGSNDGYWENEFTYVNRKTLRRYELKCITLED